MGSTNPEVEQKVFANPSAVKDVEHANSSTNSPASLENDIEPTFDTGLVSWLQVLGSFFLFFNSWYVRSLKVSSKCTLTVTLGA